MASSVEDTTRNSHENGLKDTAENEISEIDLLKVECKNWKDQTERLQTELNETKSEVAVANCLKVSGEIQKSFDLCTVELGILLTID